MDLCPGMLPAQTYASCLPEQLRGGYCTARRIKRLLRCGSTCVSAYLSAPLSLKNSREAEGVAGPTWSRGAQPLRRQSDEVIGKRLRGLGIPGRALSAGGRPGSDAAALDCGSSG